MLPRIPTPQGRAQQQQPVYGLQQNINQYCATPSSSSATANYNAAAATNQRTPSPMAKTGLANVGGFVVPPPVALSNYYQTNSTVESSYVSNQSSSTVMKKSHMSVNLASYPSVTGNNAGESSSVHSQQSTSCFVRQNFSPASTAVSRKVEKPLPQNAVAPPFAMMMPSSSVKLQNGVVDPTLLQYDLNERRQSTKVISARLDPNSVSSVRINVQPSGNVDGSKNYRLEANANSGQQILSIEALGDYSPTTAANNNTHYYALKNMQNYGYTDDASTAYNDQQSSTKNSNYVNIPPLDYGGPSTSGGGAQRNNYNASVLASPNDNARYLEHLFQRVNSVLTVRPGGGSPVPTNVHNIPLRKRDSAASSSSDTSAVDQNHMMSADNILPTASGGIQAPLVYPSPMYPGGQSTTMQPPQPMTTASSNSFMASEPFMRDGASPSSSVSTESSDGGLRGGDNAGVVRCESPLPESVRKSLIESRNTGAPFKSCLKPCTPQAFKFFMEQHIENVIKQHKDRQTRKFEV